jgi:hypothetical protein
MLFRLGILLVLLGVCLFLVLRVLKQIQSLRRPSPPSPSDALAQDPVCLVYLPKKTAVSAHGTHFCSTRCADAYATQGEQKH